MLLWLIVLFAAAIVLLLVLTARLTLHPFAALLACAVAYGLAADMSLAWILGSIGDGMAAGFGTVGLLLLAGAILAQFLERSGAGARLARVILGTVAVEDPGLVRQAAKAFPGRVAVGIDARKGRVATKGWATETDVMATDLARSFEDAGVAAIIYTDIDRDGAMQGPNIEATEALARAVTIPVIASGGVSRMEDLIALRDTGVIAGAISGRALYDGAIDLAAALKVLQG